MRTLALTYNQDVLNDTRAFFTSYADRVADGDAQAVSMMVDFWLGSGAFRRLAPPVQSFLTEASAKNARTSRRPSRKSSR